MSIDVYNSVQPNVRGSDPKELMAPAHIVQADVSPDMIEIMIENIKELKP